MRGTGLTDLILCIPGIYRLLPAFGPHGGEGGFFRRASVLYLAGFQGKASGYRRGAFKDRVEKLHDAIAKSLRKGDLFTCYNPSQYLVMLNGTSNEYCLLIYERIDSNLHLWDGARKVKLNYQVMPESLI